MRRNVRNSNRHDGFAGLGRSNQVRDRANAADARHQAGHLVVGAALREPLESPYLRNMEVRILNLALTVQLNGDFAVPFQARYRVDGDGLCHE